MTRDEEIKLAGESGRGAKARAVLENDLFKEAMAALEQDTVEKWKISPIRDTEGALALRLKWQVVSQFKRYLTDVLMTGKLADAGLAERRTMLQRAQRAAKAFTE